MTDEMAGKVLEAYKTSPLLTGLLILNLVFLLGFVWFLKGKNEQHEALIDRIMEEEKVFRSELLQSYLSCKATSGKPGYVPLIGE